MTTTRETADHAELGRKFKALAVEASAARNLDGAESMMVSIQTIYDFITSRNALLSEIAALRGERNGWRSWARDWEALAVYNGDRATQAERQRDELRKALGQISELAPFGSDKEGLQDVLVDMRQYARQALANQGADQ